MFKSQSGFSMAGAVVAGGLVAGLGLAITKVLENMNTGLNYSQVAAEEIELQQSVRNLLNNPKFCSASLKDLVFQKNNSDFDNEYIDKSTQHYNEGSEGIDISLWYTNGDGSMKTKKKFNGQNFPETNDKSRFGKIDIKALKLVLNNGVGECAGNYCEGEHTDSAQVVLLYDKQISKNNKRQIISTFDVSLKMQTDGANNTTIIGCSTSNSAATNSFGNPSQCTMRFALAHPIASGLRATVTANLNTPGFYGVRVHNPNNLDNDDYLRIESFCPASGGNELDDYLRTCSMHLGHRDSSGGRSFDYVRPVTSSSDSFASNSDMSSLKLSGDVGSDDRIYYKMVCPVHSNPELEDYVKKTCRICFGNSDSNYFGDIQRVSCKKVQSPTDLSWGQVRLVGNANADDVFYLGFFCNNEFYPEIINIDLYN